MECNYRAVSDKCTDVYVCLFSTVTNWKINNIITAWRILDDSQKESSCSCLFHMQMIILEVKKHPVLQTVVPPEFCRYVGNYDAILLSWLAVKSKSLGEEWGARHLVWTFCLDCSWEKGQWGSELALSGLPKDSRQDRQKVYCIKDESCKGCGCVVEVCRSIIMFVLVLFHNSSVIIVQQMQ